MRPHVPIMPAPPASRERQWSCPETGAGSPKEWLVSAQPNYTFSAPTGDLEIGPRVHLQVRQALCLDEA